MLKKLVKRLLTSSPYRQIKKNPQKYRIDPSTILLDGASFRFDIPDHQLNPAIIIGKDSMIGCNFIFESNEGSIKIGEHCYIGPGTNLISRSKIAIGDDVWVAWGCYIYDHDSHSLSWQDRRSDLEQQLHDYRISKNIVLNKNWLNVSTKPIVICDKVWIGFEAVILKGVTIGEGAVVAARSVVTKDVAPWTVVAGSPARFVKNVELN